MRHSVDGLLENGNRGEGEWRLGDVFQNRLHCTAPGLEQPAQHSLHCRLQAGRRAYEASSSLSGEQVGLGEGGPWTQRPVSAFPAGVDRGPSSLSLTYNPWLCSESGWGATLRQNHEVLES